MVGPIQPGSVWHTGGKPLTWFPRGTRRVLVPFLSYPPTLLPLPKSCLFLKDQYFLKKSTFLKMCELKGFLLSLRFPRSVSPLWIFMLRLTRFPVGCSQGHRTKLCYLDHFRPMLYHCRAPFLISYTTACVLWERPVNRQPGSCSDNS